MIKVTNLKKRYGTFQLDVSLNVPKGCITGLIGKNGSGKSTTIKAILGLIHPDDGEIKIAGKKANQMTVKDKQMIGAAFSDSGFNNYLTIRDVSKILGKLYPSCDPKEFLFTCRKYGLPDGKKIQEFSTGMNAKLRVLTALSHEARLLILDEPTAGMDIEARNEILDILRDYIENKEDSAILLTSHIATDLEGICDDVYLIDNGKILLHEDTDVILSDYGILKVEESVRKTLEPDTILGVKKENDYYCCLTNQKQFYIENYPGIVIERGSIDDLILILAGGK